VVISSMIYVMIAILAVVGNALVVGSFIRHARLRTFTNYFVASLAVADIIVGLISIPMWTAFVILHPLSLTYPGYVMTYTVLDIFAGITSILHLMVISLERFYAVAYPVRHRNTNAWVYYICLVFVWVVPAVFAGTSEHFRKADKKVYMITMFAVFFLLPLFVILLAYAGIWRVVRNRVIPQATQRSSNLKRDMRVIVTIALVIALFVISWLPFFIINMLITFCKNCVIGFKGLPPLYSAHLLLFVKVMHYFNSAVNPVCYAVKIPEFRRAFRQLVGL
ncbi:predicted protein, partial [Nematostella vectensis]